MIRQHDVRAIGDLYARRVDAERRQAFEFVEQRRRIDDRAAADEELDVRMQHARRNDAQRELAIADDDRVPGVVAAAEARDDVVVGGVEIDDPALCPRRPTASRR